MSKKAVCIILLAIHAYMASASEPDSIVVPHLDAFELMPVLNPWLNTSNPAGLSMNTSLLPGRMNADLRFENGDYKMVQQGKSFQYYGLESQSYKRMGNLSLFGNFRYDKSYEKELDFSNTNSPYRGTPYDYIDTLGGDTYNREFFTLNGALSKPLKIPIILGIAYDFQVGVSVQDHDPRPQNKVLDIGIRPGIIYSLPALKLGLSLFFNHYNEEIDVDIIKENTYMTLFKPLGPGVFTYHEAQSFNRLYNRNSEGVDIQLNYHKNNLNTIFGTKFTYFLENVQDGGKGGDASWNYMRNVADLKETGWSIYNTTRLVSGPFHHVVSAQIDLAASQGIEKIEKLVQVGILDMQDWVFFMEDPKYYSESIMGKLDYRLVKMADPYHSNYSLGFTGKYNSFLERYYLPEQEEWYRFSTFSVDAEKTFALKNAWFKIGGQISYKYSLDGEQNFESINFLYDKLLLPDFLYLTSNYLSPSLDISYEKKLTKLFDAFFMEAHVESFYGNNDKSRMNAGIRSGVIF